MEPENSCGLMHQESAARPVWGWHPGLPETSTGAQTGKLRSRSQVPVLLNSFGETGRALHLLNISGTSVGPAILLQNLARLYHPGKGTTKLSPRTSPFRAFGGGTVPLTNEAQTTAAFSMTAPAGISTLSARIARLTRAPSATLT